MKPSSWALICSLGAFPGVAVVAADDPHPFVDLRVEVGLAHPPQRVRDEFTNGGGAAVPTGTTTTDIDSQNVRSLRVGVASGTPDDGGSLLWGFGMSFAEADFHIADDVPERTDPTLRFSQIGPYGTLGYVIAPVPGLELEASAFAGIGLAHTTWISPDTSAGPVNGSGTGGYTEEGLRLAVGTALWRHAVIQAFAGVIATQTNSEMDYETGDSSRLTFRSGGWLVGATAGYRF